MKIILYVLYENPSDYPRKFVLRRQVGDTPDTRPLAVADKAIDALIKLPKNVSPIGRHFGDDPAIKDVWAMA